MSRCYMKCNVCGGIYDATDGVPCLHGLPADTSQPASPSPPTRQARRLLEREAAKKARATESRPVRRQDAA